MSAKPKKRAVIYARLSVDDAGAKKRGRLTNDPSLSVEAQLEACRTLCKREGYKVVGEFKDDGISGRCWPAGEEFEADAEADTLTLEVIKKKRKSKTRRPDFGKVIRMVQNHEADVVVVRDMTRFARPVFLSRLQYYLNNFFRVNANRAAIHSGTDGYINFNDDMRIMSLLMMDAAEDKRTRERAEHSAAAIRAEREKGRYWTPSIPYGYEKGTKGYIPHKKRSSYVKRLFERVSQGASLGKMVREFNGEKVPTPSMTRVNDMNRATDHRKSDTWSRSSISSIVRNPLYCGKSRVDENRVVKCVAVAKPIIGEHLFYVVQDKLDKERRDIPAKAKTARGLASGIIRCACGSTLGGHSDGKRTKAYRCRRRAETGCKGSIQSNNLDDFLGAFLSLNYVMELERIKERIKSKKGRNKLIEDEGELNRRIRESRKELSDLGKEINIKEILKSLSGMEEDLADIQRQIAELDRIPDELPASWEINYRCLNEDVRREIVRSIFEKITVYGERVEFTLRSKETFTIRRSMARKSGRGKLLPEVHASAMYDKYKNIGFRRSDFIGEKTVFLGGALNFILTRKEDGVERKAV